MTKWEYDHYPWDDIKKAIVTDGGGFSVLKELDEMGQKEWELIFIYNGQAHFKRPTTIETPKHEYEIPFERREALKRAFRDMVKKIEAEDNG